MSAGIQYIYTTALVLCHQEGPIASQRALQLTTFIVMLTVDEGNSFVPAVACVH